jgi:hypothetical protein
MQVIEGSITLTQDKINNIVKLKGVLELWLVLRLLEAQGITLCPLSELMRLTGFAKSTVICAMKSLQEQEYVEFYRITIDTERYPASPCTCQWCGVKNVIVHTHHKVEKSKGGSDNEENLMSICTSCHAKTYTNQFKIIEYIL